jgi:imidazolonepropionase-like amidohydrolase
MQEELMTKFLYCAKRLIDGTGKPPIEDAAICTEGDRILQVGKRLDFGSEFDGRKVDLGDQTLLPGLIDCHNHLCLDASIPNWPAKFDVGDIELTLRAVRNMAADLQAGITTARCLGDRSFVDVHCKQAVDSGSIAGPSLTIATRGIRATHGHGLIGYPFDGVETVRRVIRENIKAGADIIKLFLTGTVPADPITCYPSPEEIKAGIEEAHRAGLPVTAHCIGGSGFDLCLDLGIDCLEHGYFLTEKQVERLAQSDTWLVLTPSPYLSEEWQSTIPQPLAAGFRSGREAASRSMAAIIRSGAKYAVGTDGLHGRLGQDIGYLVDLGASPADALAAATTRAARVCGRAEQVGTLEAGKRADMMGVAGNPLTDIRSVNRVQTVIARGNMIRNDPGRI